MKAEDLQKEVALRTTVNTWIKKSLVNAFVESGGKPVMFSEYNARNPSNPLSHDGIKYLQELGYKVDWIHKGVYDQHDPESCTEAGFKISLPPITTARAQ